MPFKASDGTQVFEEGGREFLTGNPQNARLALKRSLRGRGGIKLFEPYLLVDLVKSEQTYSGVSPSHTLNIITALLYFSCFVNGLELFCNCLWFDSVLCFARVFLLTLLFFVYYVCV